MDSVPEEVMGEPVTVRKEGTDADTEVTVPVPGGAGVCQESVEPFEVKTCPLVPTMSKPVPPLAVGRAVPDKPMASVPDAVIGEPVTFRKAGTVAETEVTVPVPGGNGVCHESVVPSEVKTCPLVPTAVKPVPPLRVGRAVPE